MPMLSHSRPAKNIAQCYGIKLRYGMTKKYRTIYVAMANQKKINWLMRAFHNVTLNNIYEGTSKAAGNSKSPTDIFPW